MASYFFGSEHARTELWGKQTPSFVADDEMTQVNLAMLGCTCEIWRVDILTRILRLQGSKDARHVKSGCRLEIFVFPGKRALSYCTCRLNPCGAVQERSSGPSFYWVDVYPRGGRTGQDRTGAPKRSGEAGV